jgi:wyosine [tRNA(Phe)-imidazoG37] synthetase (radical SAM superfamily)
MKHKHLFGPVPSRRLGVSLGVDLIPLKTCSLDCVYCECGKTTRLTVERKEYIPVDRVIAELEVYLRNNPPLDFITFAGSGEPTLNSGLGNVISYLKQNFRQYRTCLLTNGTLFTDPEVRAEAAAVDLIIPSLDAATEDTFNRLNRPEISLDCTAIINGLEQLRSEYKGEIILEIFIVPGLNDTELEPLVLQ